MKSSIRSVRWETLPANSTAMLPDPCLLEKTELPLVELAGLAVREGRRPRPIYTGHKWFARRLGSVFRALLVGASSAPEDNFWNSYYGKADLRDIVVLDPFVGGGTTIVEALRLGATIHAVDIDPVACAVTRFEMKAGELPDLSEALGELRRGIGEAVRRYHMTQAADGAEHIVLHHFWVQVVACRECGESFDAHPNFILGEEEKHRWVFCSCCGEVHRRRIAHERFRCDVCGTRTRVTDGHVTYGRACCPRCGDRRALIEVGRSSNSPPQWRLFALEFLEKPDGVQAVPMTKRRFKKVTEHDIALYEEAAAELRNRSITGRVVLPRGARIGDKRTDSRLLDYGYRDWTELFNARQLLHLSLLAEAIAGYEGGVREGLSMAFSDHLTTNCMMTAYARGWRRLTPLFSIRAFRHVPRPVEVNPWCDGTGRGTFPNTVRKVMRAVRFAADPTEVSIGGGFTRVAARKPVQQPKLVCGTAKDLDFLGDGTVDLVLTDPPYFDNIAYSELAEFFVPWLKLLNVLDEAQGSKQAALNSLLARRGDKPSVKHYTEGLGSAFAEVGRVLKANGLLVFSYRHSTVEAWEALATGLQRSGLLVVSYMPVPGEAGIGLHAHPGTGLWDAVFVMRKIEKEHVRENLCVGLADIDAAKRRVSEWTDVLQEAPVPFSLADQVALYRAGIVARALSEGVEDHASRVIGLSSALAVQETKIGERDATGQ